MKKYQSTLGLLLVLSIHAAHAAQSTPARVSVTRFQQEVQHVFDGCSPWTFVEQDQLRTVMERELSQAGLKVLERKDIRNIYADEYELPNLNRKSRPKTGKFLSAQYTVTGGIAELGICEDSSGTNAQLGGIVSLLGGPSMDLGVSHHKSTSKVKVVANVISVETGEILQSFEASSEVSDSSYGVSGGAMGIGAGHKIRSNPPIERATNQAIRDLATQIAKYVSSTG